MPVNNHLESHPQPEPPEQEVQEMSFETDMRRAVDDLFVCEAISKRLQNTEVNEQIEGLLNHHKQILVEHLVETAYRAVNELVTDLDTLQTQAPLDVNEAISPLSPPSQQRSDVDNRVE